MTKPASNLAATLLLARDESAKLTVPLVESLSTSIDADDEGDEGDGEWIDEVTSQVAALWSGHRKGVSFESAMASAEARPARRR